MEEIKGYTIKSTSELMYLMTRHDKTRILNGGKCYD